MKRKPAKTALILALLLAFVSLLPSCGSLSKIPLRHRADHLDDRNLGDSGQTPRFRAPPGMTIDLSALYAVDGDSDTASKKAIFVDLRIRNNSDHEVTFDWKRWWLRSDDGRRFSPSKMEIYDEKTGKYVPAPTTIPAGQNQTMTLTIPTGSRLRIELIITLVLHWRFRLGNKQHAIVSFFQVT